MSNTLTWGIISTGRIAGTSPRAWPIRRRASWWPSAAARRRRPTSSASEFNVPRRYGSYEALLADKDVQAVYIATPHPMHAEWAIKAAEAGKHILCEKPIGMNHAEAMAIIEAARRHDVFLMEAFMYRCHPQTAKLVELLRQKAIGEVRVIQATFSFHAGFNPRAGCLRQRPGRRRHPGRGLLLHVAWPGWSRAWRPGKDFAEPIEVKGVGHLGADGRGRVRGARC